MSFSLLQEMEQKEYRSVEYSKAHVSELMIPAYANFGGKIHGGILLSLMDKVAYVCAAKHAGNYCVTVAVENVEFLEPVEVGEMVTMVAEIHYVGRTSMVVGISVTAENFKLGTVKRTNNSYFTMVAKDDNGSPTGVPGLILENREQVNRFAGAIKRRELKSQYKKELQNMRASLAESNQPELLVNERCVLRC